MKKIIFCTFLACLFALGNTAFALSNQLDGGIVLEIIYSKGGGVELEIVYSETSKLLFAVNLPQRYIDKNGNLIAPIEVSLVKNGKVVTHSLLKNIEEYIPIIVASGTYEIKLIIGTYSTSGIIKF